jgi:hypothetical protein
VRLLNSLRLASVVACIFLAFTLLAGCATNTHSHFIHFSQPELRLIPVISLQRIASAHSEDEVVVVKVDGHTQPVGVKEFKRRESVIVYGVDGKETEIVFSAITDLQVFKKQQTANQTVSHKVSNVSGAAEGLVYAPLLPVAIGTWPLLRAMGLDQSKNESDNARARLIYHGLSRQDLLSGVGIPREKYSCIQKLNLREKRDIAHEIWVYDESLVLRGGRTLFIDQGTGIVSHNSFHTTFFKNSSSFSCLPLINP